MSVTFKTAVQSFGVWYGNYLDQYFLSDFTKAYSPYFMVYTAKSKAFRTLPSPTRK